MRNSILDEVVERSLAERQATYSDEVHRFVDAGLAVMRRDESVSPRVSEIVKEAGLSNQAFYRHFKGKDELLAAIMEDGLRQLLAYLEHQMDKERQPEGKVRRWIEGVLAQAADGTAADRTRPFVLDSLRLAARFPDETARSQAAITEPLRNAVAALPGHRDPDRDADAIYHLTMGRMQSAIARGQLPRRADVEHIVAFSLRGVRGA
jgi:AcrR family transcriptional regulator